MNKVILIGNMTRDPELSTIPNGTSVCKFGIAVSRRFANADGNRDTDFFNIVAWRALGENVSKFCKKGSKVGIVGSLQTRSYEAQDGSKRHVTEIVADEVEFLSRNDNSQQGANDGATQADKGEMVPVEDTSSLPF